MLPSLECFLLEKTRELLGFIAPGRPGERVEGAEGTSSAGGEHGTSSTEQLLVEGVVQQITTEILSRRDCWRVPPTPKRITRDVLHWELVAPGEAYEKFNAASALEHLKAQIADTLGLGAAGGADHFSTVDVFDFVQNGEYQKQWKGIVRETTTPTFHLDERLECGSSLARLARGIAERGGAASWRGVPPPGSADSRMLDEYRLAPEAPHRVLRRLRSFDHPTQGVGRGNCSGLRDQRSMEEEHEEGEIPMGGGVSATVVYTTPPDPQLTTCFLLAPITLTRAAWQSVEILLSRDPPWGSRFLARVLLDFLTLWLHDFCLLFLWRHQELACKAALHQEPGYFYLLTTPFTIHAGGLGSPSSRYEENARGVRRSLIFNIDLRKLRHLYDDAAEECLGATAEPDLLPHVQGKAGEALPCVAAELQNEPDQAPLAPPECEAPAQEVCAAAAPIFSLAVARSAARPARSASRPGRPEVPTRGAPATRKASRSSGRRTSQEA